jgi:hypothetical protein
MRTKFAGFKKNRGALRSLVVQRYQPALDCPPKQLNRIAHAGRLQKGRSMGYGSFETDAEFDCDFLGAEACTNQPEHFLLASGRLKGRVSSVTGPLPQGPPSSRYGVWPAIHGCFHFPTYSELAGCFG